MYRTAKLNCRISPQTDYMRFLMRAPFSWSAFLFLCTRLTEKARGPNVHFFDLWQHREMSMIWRPIFRSNQSCNLEKYSETDHRNCNPIESNCLSKKNHQNNYLRLRNSTINYNLPKIWFDGISTSLSVCLDKSTDKFLYMQCAYAIRRLIKNRAYLGYETVNEFRKLRFHFINWYWYKKYHNCCWNRNALETFINSKRQLKQEYHFRPHFIRPACKFDKQQNKAQNEDNTQKQKDVEWRKDHKARKSCSIIIKNVFTPGFHICRWI